MGAAGRVEDGFAGIVAGLADWVVGVAVDRAIARVIRGGTAGSAGDVFDVATGAVVRATDCGAGTDDRATERVTSGAADVADGGIDAAADRATDGVPGAEDRATGREAGDAADLEAGAAVD